MERTDPRLSCDWGLAWDSGGRRLDDASLAPTNLHIKHNSITYVSPHNPTIYLTFPAVLQVHNTRVSQLHNASLLKKNKQHPYNNYITHHSQHKYTTHLSNKNYTTCRYHSKHQSTLPSPGAAKPWSITNNRQLWRQPLQQRQHLLAEDHSSQRSQERSDNKNYITMNTCWPTRMREILSSNTCNRPWLHYVPPRTPLVTHNTLQYILNTLSITTTHYKLFHLPFLQCIFP